MWQGAGMQDDPRVHVESAADLAGWLAANHATHTGVWVVQWRGPTGRPAPTYEEAVCEALRYGWIDSVQKRLDEERTMMRYTPRRPGSGWSRPNKVRIARLEAEGRLAPAGQAVVEAARADGSWSLLDAVEALEVPDDLGVALDATPGAREGWAALGRSAKRAALLAILQAKRPATRAAKVAQAVQQATGG